MFERFFHYTIYGEINPVTLMTGLYFFIYDGDLTYWFISSIIAIYICSPFYLKLFDKSPKIVSFIGLLLSVVLIIFDLRYHQGKFIIFLTRLPSFFVGVYFGFLSDTQCKIKNRTIYVQLLILCCFSLGLWDYFKALGRMPYFYKYIIFIVMAPCFIMSCCYVLDYFRDKLRLLYRAISYLGSISFEVYLIYEMLLNIFIPVMKKAMNFDNTYIIYATLLFLVTTVFADWVKKLYQSVLKLQIHKLTK